MTHSKVSLSLCAALLSVLLSLNSLARAQDTTATPKVPDLVETAFRYGDFAELERLYAIYGKPGVRSPLTGMERLTHFWMGVGKITDSNLRVTEIYYTQMDAMTSKWATEHPQSVLAQLLYAKSLSAHAWFFRGTGFADTVSPTSWAAFKKYLNLALDQLQRNAALAAKDSSWNRQVLDVGRGLGWNAQRLLPVFESGIAKNPDDDELYFDMQMSLLPKWGGDLETVERFIATVDQRTRDKRGMEMYARLYANLSYQQVKLLLFSSTQVSWPKMKSGFDDLLSRYPHSDHRNRYAYFACMANDREVLQEQIALIGDSFERIFWGSSPERRFDECRAMVKKS